MTPRISDLIKRLHDNPFVIGLVRYGGRSVEDRTLGGDFDIFVFVRERDTDLESIHFYWGEMPVDLSIRTLEDLHLEKPISYIDPKLAEGEILYDRAGGLQELIAEATTRWSDSANALPESDMLITRFYQKHVLDKVRGRQNSDPVFCELLLSTNITWLLHTYFKVRCLSFPGEKGALNWMRRDEPEIAERIDAFFNSTSQEVKLRISEELTDLVLEPIGGPWKQGEILGTTGDSEATNLLKKAESAFARIVGTSEDNPPS